MAINGEAHKFILPALASLGGLVLGVVTMIGFLYGQFYTIREHEEFRKTLSETQHGADDHMKRLDQMAVDNQKEIAIVRGFIDAHRTPGK